MPQSVSGESLVSTSRWFLGAGYLLQGDCSVCMAKGSDGMKKGKGKEMKSSTKPSSVSANPAM